ncbi:MAG: PstS family phosphate ABC transporter substrate-binding protein [Pseudomonadales bacterium]
MKKKALIVAAAVLAGGLANTVLAQSRDYVSVVGSSTVYPFATVVAERFGRSSGMKTPKIESTGSGGGMKLFCTGVGAKTADITNSSRRIKKSEFESCQANGVKDVVEVLIGYDGIALANSNKAPVLSLTRKDIFLALAAEVPNPDGTETLVANPHKTWKQVNSSLPEQRIEVLGPPPTSGTRDAFAELAMEGGCKKYSWIAAIKKKDKNQYKATCHTIREDGAYIEAGENDNLIVQKLDSNPNALGVFGFSFLDQNSDKVQGSIVEGSAPTFETISDKSYPISRPLYVYVKKAHVGVIPGIAEYMAEFTSEKAWGEEGYLADKGMIPLSDDARATIGADVKNLSAMSGTDL